VLHNVRAIALDVHEFDPARRQTGTIFERARSRRLYRRAVESLSASVAVRSADAVSRRASSVGDRSLRVAGVTGPSVVHVLPDKMGGAVNLTANLLRFRRRDAFRHIALLTHNSLSTDERFGGALDADAQTVVEYALPLENIHAVLHRLRRAVPDERACWLPRSARPSPSRRRSIAAAR